MKQNTYKVNEKIEKRGISEFNGMTKGSGYNPYQTGHGIHEGKREYKRCDAKQALHEMIKNKKFE